MIMMIVHASCFVIAKSRDSFFKVLVLESCDVKLAGVLERNMAISRNDGKNFKLVLMETILPCALFGVKLFTCLWYSLSIFRVFYS